MRFLADESCDVTLAQALLEEGHDVLEVIGFKIRILARREGEGCIVIRRRPITQPKPLS